MPPSALVVRLRGDAPLNAWNRATFYGGNELGYTDYPVLEVESGSTALGQ